MTTRRTLTCLLSLILTPVLAFAQSPAQIFEDAVAFWGMGDAEDQCGANSALVPAGGSTKFGVPLAGDALEASALAGGDGLVVALEDAALVVGQGAGGEINLTGRSLTMLLRLRRTGGDWNTTLFSKHGGHDLLQYNMFCFDLDGSLDLGVEVGTLDAFAKTGAVIDADGAGGWHTVVARYDGSALDLFVDGVRVGSTALDGSLRPASDVPLVIAGEPMPDGSVSRRFTGLIDHAALWDRALSAAEIATLSPGKTEPLYQERFRPAYHFTPPKNWINDPNGMLYADGVYHLFYQHNPFGDTWGHMSWGHATSPDMLTWEHQPLALPEEEYMIFSGSAVNDVRNTSGLGTAEDGPLVAVYTGHHWDRNRQNQQIASSTDGGTTWTKFADNPVIDLDLPHHRDPKVIWHQPTQRWIMAVALAVDRVVQFYASEDLVNWTHLSDFGPAGATGVPNWECPELFELPIDGEEDSRWILQIDVGDGAPNGGSGGQYFVGQFDGERFVNDNPPETVLWVDYGRDFYAAQAFNDVPDGRVIWLAWMNNWRYANQIPTRPWRGAMTLPREVSLVRTWQGLRIRQHPIAELCSLRGESVTLADLRVEPGRTPLAEYGASGDALEIIATFEIGDAKRFGLRVRESAGPNPEEFTTIGYDVRLREMYVDRRSSGQIEFHDGFAGHHAAPLFFEEDGLVTLHVFVDRSSVEVFGNDGLASITDQIFPSSESVGVALFAEQGATTLRELRLFRVVPTNPNE